MTDEEGNGTWLGPVPFKLLTVRIDGRGAPQEVAVKSTIETGALATIAIVLAGLTSSAHAQTSPTGSQFTYKRALQRPARAREATPDPAVTLRCDDLAGLVTRLAKSECERRDTVSDDAPAGMTPAIRERKERLRAQAAASYGEPIRY